MATISTELHGDAVMTDLSHPHNFKGFDGLTAVIGLWAGDTILTFFGDQILKQPVVFAPVQLK